MENDSTEEVRRCDDSSRYTYYTVKNEIRRIAIKGFDIAMKRRKKADKC